MIRSKGFSLVELAVALFIIALLLAGALVPLSSQIDVRNAAETQRNMESVRDALIGFAQANGRLPCPANGATPAGAVDTTTWATPVGAGAEQWNPGVGANTCYTFVGVLPWTTLGVPETDAWGRRFTYRVSQVFADGNAAGTWSTTTPAPQLPLPACNPTPVPAAPTTFALCSLGNIAVFTRGGTSTTATPLGTALPAVVISHGKNGFGGWQTTGIRLTPVPVGNDEAANAFGLTQAAPAGGYLSWAYYSRIRTPAAASCADPAPPPTPSGSPPCEFDDIVMMISSSALIARMVAAGRLP
jgi:prepilin-type N-terminal cleavage/methylation domain-containing protein